MILFRDSGQTLLILDDFRVSRLEKYFFFVLFFNCKTNLRRDLLGSFLGITNFDFLHVSRLGKIKFLTQSGQMQN